jgi:glutamate-1-semialdehyde 2,1-aminomutase
VTLGQTSDTIVLDYNDTTALTELFETQGDQIAAVLTEAVPANMGVVPPVTGFNKLIADLCTRHGALMVLDEVMTGFRISAGGWWAKYGIEENWEPDLFCYGKVIGGGFPLAAVAGKQEVMDLLAPVGPVYQAGTLSGNPVATVAGLTTLQNCTAETYEHLDLLANKVGSGISEILTSHQIPHSYQFAGNLFSIFFTNQNVTNYETAKTQDVAAFKIFFNSLLNQGISIPPSAFEAWFVSDAMTDADINQILQATEVAAKEIANTLRD